MDVARYLEPRGEDSPSGDNLEYDSDFIAMELAAQPGEESEMGDSVIEAAEPDYRDLSEKALAVLERSHDLRAASHLALAQLQLKGLTGFSEVISYIRGCLEQHWETCHPQLDAEDDDDPTMRVNAVLTLADPMVMMRALRLAPLTDSRGFGRFSLRDILVAQGDMAQPADMATVPETSFITAAFEDTDAEALEALLAAARSALDDVTEISACFDDRTPGRGPDLDPLVKLLRQIVGSLASAGGSTEEAGAEEAPEAAAEGARAPLAGERRSAPGVIASRTDAMAALDQVIAYFQKNEPSSPIPILVARAKKMVGADFLTIVQELAPGGLDNVHLIGGIEREDNY